MATADNVGKLYAYTVQEMMNAGLTRGNLHTLNFGLQRSMLAALNAAEVFNRHANDLNGMLENSDMYSLSEVQTLFNKINTDMTALNNALS